MKTFFEKVKAWFAKVFKDTPAWEKAASAAITYVAPLLETIVALTAGEPLANEIQVIIGKIQSDMGVVAVTLEDATATPSLSGVLSSINSNLASLLAAGQIKDPTTVSKVTAVVGTISGEVTAIAAAIPAADPAATTEAAA